MSGDAGASIVSRRVMGMILVALAVHTVLSAFSAWSVCRICKKKRLHVRSTSTASARVAQERETILLAGVHDA
jgi:hypothetical protein